MTITGIISAIIVGIVVGILGRLGLAALPLALIWLLYFWGTR